MVSGVADVFLVVLIFRQLKGCQVVLLLLCPDAPAELCVSPEAPPNTCERKENLFLLSAGGGVVSISMALLCVRWMVAFAVLTVQDRPFFSMTR